MASLLEAVRISIVELGEREGGARGIVAPILGKIETMTASGRKHTWTLSIRMRVRVHG